MNAIGERRLTFGANANVALISVNLDAVSCGMNGMCSSLRPVQLSHMTTTAYNDQGNTTARVMRSSTPPLARE